ncbi:MAG: glycosyltransferase family 2 protein [Pseudomonadota bacterium]
MQITTVTCVKNEGPFLLEWLAFHRVIGVSHFLIYSNDCTDGTDRLLNCLNGHGIVTHLPNPATGRAYQMQALKAARQHACVKSADWVWIADVDEFLNIHVGNHRIPDLITACGDPQAISLNFQFMANGGVDWFEDKPVIEQFLQTHNPDIWAAQTAIEVKTLVRSDFPLAYFGAHRPFHDKTRSSPAWTDGSGRRVPENYRNRLLKRRIRAFPARGSRRFATLNHYALRSRESFLVKQDRGDVNRERRAFDVEYWRDRNDTAHRDTSILRYRKPLLAEMERLKALEGVAALHQQSVEQHKALCSTLMKDTQTRAAAEALASAPAFSAREQEIRSLIGLAEDQAL